MRATILALRIASIAMVLMATHARAHLAPPRVRADRAITITLGDPITLLYDVRISGNELRRVRTDGDVDQDGALSHGEVEALLGRWTQALLAHVRTAADGKTFEPLGKARVLSREATGLDGPIANTDPFASFAARIAWKIEVGSDDRGLFAIDDGAAFLPFDHTDFVVKDAPPRAMIDTGDDLSRMAHDPRIGWVDSARASTHRVYVRYRAPQRSRWMTAVAIVAVAIVTSFVWARAVRASNRSPRSPRRPPL